VRRAGGRGAWGRGSAADPSTSSSLAGTAEARLPLSRIRVSYYHFKSLIALLVMVAGVTALTSMLTLMGRSDARLGGPALRAIHRAAGYAFAVLVAVATVMGLRHLGFVADALPLRGVVHWVLATLLVVVLGLKVVISRFFKQLLKLAPALGLTVFSLAFVVVVVSAVFFLITGGVVGAWAPAVEVLTSQTQPVEASGLPDVALGEALFARHCSHCHYADRGDSKIGPGLAGLLSRGTLSSTGMPATVESVRAQILDPVGAMPSFAARLSDEELRDLLAYVATL
jgi:mono/diheme cytochrome c family protein